MKIVLMGYVSFSKQTLKKLVNLGANVVGVVTKKRSTFNADFCDLGPLCQTIGIPFIHMEDVNDQRIEAWIRLRSPDVIFC